jgi:signal transduction histidine kinase
VLAHLLQNALDASRPGQPVRVRVASEDPHAVLEVADEGVGMSEQYVKERLGKPFETTKSSGMGIGVYESAQYVNGLGGEIQVDSHPGAGTCVRVLIPAMEPAAAGPVMIDEHVA